MFLLRKFGCRAFQTVFRLALPVLPYRTPERMYAVEAVPALCRKKGIVPLGGRCAAFRYDPMKRCPPRPLKPDTGKLREEDFLL